jgi:hypothetical protein
LGLTAVGGLIFMAMDGLYGVFAGAKNGYGKILGWPVWRFCRSKKRLWQDIGMACMAFLQEQKTAMARYWDGHV